MRRQRVPYPRFLLLLAATVYSVFVVYGSLVPLDYRAMPVDEALSRFRAIPYLDLGMGSRADWVANILLFVPLAFLWLGVLWHRWNAGLRVLASLAVLAVLGASSVLIEFTQLFFPPRTVSQNDILAECIGALVGVVAWWAFGPRLVRWLASWLQGRGDLSLAQRLLAVYLAALYAYALLPLDLTISPVEVFHKLQEGRLVLIPFGGLPGDAAQAAYDLLTDVAIWVPVGFLWRRSGITGARALRNVLLTALLLEFLQLWVFSRVSDVTDILTAALGGWIGVFIGARGTPVVAAPGAARSTGPGVALLCLAGMVVWIGVLMGVFWYPFDFRTDGQFLRERLATLQQAPFTAYYYGTEFRAATEVLHKLLFFAPLGFLSAAAMIRLRWPRLMVWGLGLAVVAGAGGLIEAGQLALPGKNADITDWVLEVLGGALGIWLALAMRAAAIPAGARPARDGSRVGARHARDSYREPGSPPPADGTPRARRHRAP